MFTTVYHPTVNGVVVSVDAFRQGLRSLGHDVFVFGPDASGYKDEEPYIFRYPALELPVQKYPLALPVSPFVDRLLPRLKPHVLHANHPALLGQVAADKSKRLHIPLVFTYHTRYRDYSHYAKLIPQDLVKDFIEHWLAHFLRGCHQVVVPSGSIEQMVKDTYGIERGLSVVPTGIDAARFRVPDRDEARAELGLSGKVLVSVGRLAQEKNFDFLIRSLARVTEEVDDVQLIILGEGDERENLETLISCCDLDGQVHLPGLVPHDAIPTYFRAADLFAFASVTETQGLVTLEGMAAGLPVVAVKASGTSDVVEHGRNGFLVDCDEQALAQAILELLGDSQRMAHYSQHSIDLSESFSLENQARKMEAAYREAMERHREDKTVLLDTWSERSPLEEFLRFFKPLRPKVPLRE